MNFSRIIAPVLLATALAGCATSIVRLPNGAFVHVSNGGSQISGTKSVSGASGARIKIAFIAAINPDCTTIDGMIVRAVDKPANGTVELVQNADFPIFTRNNPRSACNTRRVSGTTVFYRSRSGFTGEDTFSYDWFTPAGIKVHVNVIAHIE